ncbi:hypothetical protein [Ferrimonas balearica]|uniref:hypothetical protein n=1 Tax=Ferrimonas balearica TaxID=44012 RepID=UPI001C99FFE3|nr:hypothetical protein [Ferrimonas balearica]MBY5992505.1 hypothetical protein [Ferrimonas balearica]
MNTKISLVSLLVLGLSACGGSSSDAPTIPQEPNIPDNEVTPPNLPPVVNNCMVDEGAPYPRICEIGDKVGELLSKDGYWHDIWSYPKQDGDLYGTARIDMGIHGEFGYAKQTSFLSSPTGEEIIFDSDILMRAYEDWACNMRDCEFFAFNSDGEVIGDALVRTLFLNEEIAKEAEKGEIKVAAFVDGQEIAHDIVPFVPAEQYAMKAFLELEGKESHRDAIFAVLKEAGAPLTRNLFDSAIYDVRLAVHGSGEGAIFSLYGFHMDADYILPTIDNPEVYVSNGRTYVTGGDYGVPVSVYDKDGNSYPLGEIPFDDVRDVWVSFGSEYHHMPEASREAYAFFEWAMSHK